MPVKERTVEDFALIWSKYDNKATGFIKIDDLNKFLIDMAKYEQEDGG